MTTMTSLKRLTLTGLFAALCCILPVAFHAAGIGSALSPIHIPVLMCGLVCGGWYGLVCGIIGPILSCVLSGMPPVDKLIYHLPELMVYGFLAGCLMKRLSVKKHLPRLYLSLVSAMVAGRIAGGVAKTLFYFGTGKSITLAALVSGYFVTALPGILCHLVVIPILVMTLYKARMICLD